MLHPLTEHELRDLTPGGLWNVKLYGQYLMDHNLVDKEGSINVTGMDPNAYVMYCWTRRWRAKRKFKEALDHAFKERIRDMHAHAAQLSSLFSHNHHKWGWHFVLCKLEECICLMRVHGAQLIHRHQHLNAIISLVFGYAPAAGPHDAGSSKQHMVDLNIHA
jgi:hypothetical protein